MKQSGRIALLWSSLLVVASGSPNLAHAQVVAFGSSNTAGQGLSSQDAYPAQLEAMLRTKGLNVHVTNAGVVGDRVPQMLARLDSAIPPGTRVVIFQPGAGANGSEVVAKLKERGVKVIKMGGIYAGIPASMKQADGLHLTAEGNRLLASRLLPQVISALK